MHIKFNVNEEVRIKLTVAGREALKIDHERNPYRLTAYRPPKEDAEGWSTWQLWELMRALGPHVYNGCTVPFETEIEFIVSEATSTVSPPPPDQTQELPQVREAPQQ